MLNLTVKNLVNACQNDIREYIIRRIDPGVHTAYDPEEDTELVYSGYYFAEIDKDTLESEVQDFEITRVRSMLIFI